MEQGFVDSDATEGEAVTDTTEMREAHVSRGAMWVRHVVVEGPADWVEKTRTSSLADGLHVVGHIDGQPCTVRIVTEGIDVSRIHSIPVPNSALYKLQEENPEAFEAIHGPGSAPSSAPELSGGYI